MNHMLHRLITVVLPALAIYLCVGGCEESGAKSLAPNPQPPAEVGREFKVIHVYVALCDNDSQGIAPVPVKIGNGDDPANNLYWGCSDGARPIFTQSPLWKRLSVSKLDKRPEILQRIVFQHQKTKAIMVVDAWRGVRIKPCIKEFCQSLAGQHYESLPLKLGDKNIQINLAGGADFLTFIGHNGLMDFHAAKIPANPNRKQSVDAAILCCKSKAFFSDHLETAGVTPTLMTASNMYPGAFILHDVLEGWFKGEDRKKLRLRAARAYAKNQHISTKSALSVFAPLP